MKDEEEDKKLPEPSSGTHLLGFYNLAKGSHGEMLSTTTTIKRALGMIALALSLEENKMDSERRPTLAQWK